MGTLVVLMERIFAIFRPSSSLISTDPRVLLKVLEQLRLCSKLVVVLVKKKSVNCRKMKMPLNLDSKSSLMALMKDLVPSRPLEELPLDSPSWSPPWLLPVPPSWLKQAMFSSFELCRAFKWNQTCPYLSHTRTCVGLSRQ